MKYYAWYTHVCGYYNLEQLYICTIIMSSYTGEDISMHFFAILIWINFFSLLEKPIWRSLWNIELHHWPFQHNNLDTISKNWFRFKEITQKWINCAAGSISMSLADLRKGGGLIFEFCVYLVYTYIMRINIQFYKPFYPQPFLFSPSLKMLWICTCYDVLFVCLPLGVLWRSSEQGGNRG